MAEVKLNAREYELIQEHVHSEYVRSDGEWGAYHCLPHDKPWIDCAEQCKCGHACRQHVPLGEGEDGGFIMCCVAGCNCRRTEGPWAG